MLKSEALHEVILAVQEARKHHLELAGVPGPVGEALGWLEDGLWGRWNEAINEEAGL